MRLKFLTIFLLFVTLLQPTYADTQSINVKNTKIFSINFNSTLASDITQQLKMQLSQIDIKNFKDGEILTKLKEDVTGNNCIVVSATQEEINASLMKLLITIDASKRNFANSIIVVIPYFIQSYTSATTKKATAKWQKVGALISFIRLNL